MPRDVQDLNRMKAEFFDVAQMPNIVGAIDCTHIKIKNPGGEYAQTFVNRKNFFSLNVQVVCDARARILNIVARHRGSVHDSRIWDECQLKTEFQNGNIQGILVGDSGYACTNYLLTPVLNPARPAQERYNEAHIRTRNCIERLFGQWKNKFQCMYNGLKMSLETAKATIVTLAIIHNLCIDHRLDPEDHDLHIEADDNQDEVIPDRINNIRGNLFRERYIQNHFN